MSDLSHSGATLGTVASISEFKSLDSQGAGYFEGYGAIYGNIDRGGDVIEPGAFAKSLHEIKSGGLGAPPMYYNHSRPGGTIGVWDHVSEDSRGLEVKGRVIALDTEQGRLMHARIKEGAMKGLSIGFRIPAGGYKRGSGRNGEPMRYLKQISLREISLVDDPMNTAAKFTFIKQNSAPDEAGLKAEDVKSVDDLVTLIIQNAHIIAPAIATKGWKDAIRDFEGLLLRDEAGFSNAVAKAIATSGFKATSEPRDEDGQRELANFVRETLMARTFSLT